MKRVLALSVAAGLTGLAVVAATPAMACGCVGEVPPTGMSAMINTALDLAMPVGVTAASVGLMYMLFRSKSA